MADDVKLWRRRPSSPNSHTAVSPTASAAAQRQDKTPEQPDFLSSACFSGLSNEDEAQTTCGILGLATTNLLDGDDHSTSTLSRPSLAEENENIQPSSTPLSDPGDSNMRRILTSLFRELRTYSVSNMEYFQNGKQSYHARLQVAFALLCEHIDAGIEPQVRPTFKIALGYWIIWLHNFVIDSHLSFFFILFIISLFILLHEVIIQKK